ncbi:Cell division protein ZapA [Neomoorella glycerini]|uniref:Cell division protein ZapA n=1 Tax=Neomoorella glycerini TaxID=55779 RepID=A0A6I5ZMP7_9FIRM|nr:cell division protein ZapA [Moorella glycerini]QGP90847.1 Cell division protein ZapA [Moorella glycerini]
MPQAERQIPVQDRTTVNINGQDYIVKGEAPEYIQMLASYVDKKMRQVSQKFPHYPPVKVAVLAALNIADELYKVQQDYDTLVKLIQEEKRG